MNISELIAYGKKYLHTNQVNILLSELLGYNPLEIYLHLENIIDEDKVNKYKKMVKELANNKPIQYVLGNVNFYGLPFYVDENVLIPRFETEELVENTLKYINKLFPNKDLKAIDLGCGSGNIGITLKKMNDNLRVTCLDISDKALNVAKKNARLLNADIDFVLGDMLDNINTKYDIIISNPPYISENEEIEDIVRDNEPHLALYASDNGLYFYNKILSECKKNLNDKFLIALEIGMTQKEDVINLAHKYLDNIRVECLKDLSNKDRMIFIYSV